MSSFIFNEFKKRYINGEVPANDIWQFTPVNSEFKKALETDKISLPQYRNLNDISVKLNNTINENTNEPYTFEDVRSKINYQFYKYYNLYESGDAAEPLFITINNINKLISVYPEEADLMNLFFDPSGVFYRWNSGFYYVRTLEQLNWCANRVNGDTEDGSRTDSFNNNIAIVLGNDIGNEVVNEVVDTNTVISNYIGKYSDRPFEGLLYGNGHIFKNITLHVMSECAGIVGYLGSNGIINNVYIYGNNNIYCKKKITLDHIKNDGRDVTVGLLCGKNYGQIDFCKINSLVPENEYEPAHVNINGFIPGVYCVRNKSEDATEPINESDTETNYFYPNYMCINSPGNIIPYVGYFNEGLIAANSANGNDYVLNSPHVAHPFWVQNMNCDWTGVGAFWDGTRTDDGIPADAANVINLFDYNALTKTYDALNEPVFGLSAGFFSVNTFIPEAGGSIPGKFMDGYQIDEINSAPWMNHPVKMHQNSRAAYYISPLCGWSKGTISNTNVHAILLFNDTFVGFAGGLCGKLAGGILNKNSIHLTSRDSEFREIFSVSSENSISVQTPQIQFETNQYTMKDINTRCTDFYTSAIDNLHVINPHDDFTEIQSNLFPDAQGLFINFNGLKCNSVVKDIYYCSAGSLSNTALETVFSNVVNNNFVESVDAVTAKFTSVSATNKYVRAETPVCDVYDSDGITSAVWFPLLYNEKYTNIAFKQAYANNEFTYDPLTNCYTINTPVSFVFGYGKGILKLPGNRQYFKDTKDGKPGAVIDDYYPDFNIYSNAKDQYPYMKTYQSKVSQYNFQGSNKAASAYDYYEEVPNEDGSMTYTKIEDLSAHLGHITSAFEQTLNSTLSDTNYTNWYNTTTAYRNLSASCMWEPTITFGKMTFSALSPYELANSLMINDNVKYVYGNTLKLIGVEDVSVNTYHAEVGSEVENGTVKNGYIRFTHNTMKFDKIELYQEGHERIGNGASVSYDTFNLSNELYATYERTDVIGGGATGNMQYVEHNEYNKQFMPTTFYNAIIDPTAESYRMQLKSIHNVGGIAGSIAVTDGTLINETTGWLNNKIGTHVELAKDSEGNVIDWNTSKVYLNNYSPLERYGALAAVMELNSSNFSDNPNTFTKPFNCINSVLKYEEVDADESTFYAPNAGVIYGPMQLASQDGTYPFGVASPIIAEIKPTYLSVPSINSYMNSWAIGGEPIPLITYDKSKFESPSFTSAGCHYYGAFSNELGYMANSYTHGEYSMDLNLDLPVKNVYMNRSNHYSWFLFDQTQLARQALNLTNTIIATNNYGVFNENGIVPGNGYRIAIDPISTITVPADSQINTANNLIDYLCSITTIAKYSRLGSENSKVKSNYQYFGSSLMIGGVPGTIANNMLRSNLGITPPEYYVTPLTEYYNMQTYLPLKHNVLKNNAISYTYDRYYNSPEEMNDPELNRYYSFSKPVSFASLDNKMGYWVHNTENLGYSGLNTYFDGSVLNMGIVKHPINIKNDINTFGYSFTETISAVDYQGLLVNDTRGNNIMYIDTSVGDMNGTGAWTMQLPKAVGQNNAICGLLLEVK